MNRIPRRDFLQRTSLAAASLACMSSLRADEPAAGKRPNVIVILTDFRDRVR